MNTPSSGHAANHEISAATTSLATTSSATEEELEPIILIDEYPFVDNT